MAIVDYDKKLEIATDFYNQAISVLKTIHNSILGFQVMYNFNLLEDQVDDNLKRSHFINIEDEVEKAKQQLLIDLGRVGEYAIKYLLVLIQINDYPNQSLEIFNSKRVYSICTNAVGNTYINNYHMPTTIVDAAKAEKESHDMQPLHDYDYLYAILKLLHPEIVADIHQVLELQVRQDLINESDLTEKVKEFFYLFPDADVAQITDLSSAEYIKYKEKFDRIIHDSGDVFTRLRYLENNTENKQYDLNEVIYMINKLVHYIELVHENKDNVSLDPIIAFRKKTLLDKKSDELMNSAPEEDRYDYYQANISAEKDYIDDVFAIERIAKSKNLQNAVFMGSKLSAEELQKLCSTNLDEDELFALISNNITKEYLDFFYQMGMTKVPNIVRLVTRSKYSLEEMKKLQIEKDDLPLLEWLDLKALEELKQNSTIYEYIKKNTNILRIFFRNYYPTRKDYELFKKITSIKEFNSNPKLLHLLDSNQLKIHRDLYGSDLPQDDIVENIRDNIHEFRGKPIVGKIPIMLDRVNTIKILQLIRENGFDDSMIKDFDSTIFCIPYEMFSVVMKILNEKNIPFIEDGIINTKVYSILDSMREDERIKMKPLPIRSLKISSVIDFSELTPPEEEEKKQYS